MTDLLVSASVAAASAIACEITFEIAVRREASVLYCSPL